MLFMMPGDGRSLIRPGIYQFGDAVTGTGGYFDQQWRALFDRPFFCRDMDFDSNRAADDEDMNNGETLVQVNGDEVKIKFDFISSRNGHMQGEYHGRILYAN